MRVRPLGHAILGLALCSTPVVGGDWCLFHRAPAAIPVVAAPIAAAPVQFPVQQVPVMQTIATVQAPTQQQSLTDLIALINLINQISGGATGGGGNGGGSGGGCQNCTNTNGTNMGSGAAQQLSAAVTRLDNKIEALNSRLTKIEEDVTTVQKAHTESLRQIDDRLVRIAGLVEKNAEQANGIAKAVERTQSETVAILKGWSSADEKPLKSAIDVDLLEESGTATIAVDTPILVFGPIPSAANPGKLVYIVRWKVGADRKLGTIDKRPEQK